MPFILRDGNGDQRGRADGKEHGNGKQRVGKGDGEVDGAHGVFVYADRDHEAIDHGVEREYDLRSHRGGDKTDEVMFQTFPRE